MGGRLAPALDGSGPAPGTRELVDAEVRRILDECYVQARDTLSRHRDRLERLARALLAAETLDAARAHGAADLPPRDGADDPLRRTVALDGTAPMSTAGPVAVGEESSVGIEAVPR